MKDQSFRTESAVFQSRCDMMMHEVLSFVQIEPTNAAHRLTLDDYSLLFFRVEELQLHAHARTLWSMLQAQQAQARLEWAAALAVPLPPASAGSEALITAETARSMPTLLQVPCKLVGLMVQSLVSAEGAQFAATLLFNQILPRALPAPIITRPPTATASAGGFSPEPPPAFGPAPASDAAASATDLDALSSPLLASHPDPPS